MLHGELDELAGAVVVGGNHRGILRAVREILALPDRLAGLLIERDDRAAASTGSADDLVAVHQYRFGVTPARSPAAEGLHRLFPDHFPIRDFRANQIAPTAQGIDVIAIHGGRAARAVAPAVLENLADLRRPKLLAILDAHGDELLAAVADAHGEELAAHDGIAGVTEPGIFENPELLRSAFRPGFQQALLGADVIAVRPAPLGPVGGVRDRGGENQRGESAGNEVSEGFSFHVR